MNLSGSNKPDSAETVRCGNSSEQFADSPEATLRLVAMSDPPAGLEERIQARLRSEMRAGFRIEMPKARILAWPSASSLATSSTISAGWRAAAAAAIVAVVVGGGWGIASRVQPASSARNVVAPVRAVGPGGFSSAGAMRTPQTFNGPVLVPAGQEQPTSRNAAKNPSPRKANSPASPVQQDGPAENQAPGQTK
jgi:hypothetical protein